MVVLLPDSGRGYLEKIFNDDWLAEHGYDDVLEATRRDTLLEDHLGETVSAESSPVPQQLS